MDGCALGGPASHGCIGDSFFLGRGNRIGLSPIWLVVLPFVREGQHGGQGRAWVCAPCDVLRNCEEDDTSEPLSPHLKRAVAETTLSLSSKWEGHMRAAVVTFPCDS